ncbi:MAG: response regulator transcription factor [Alphaproteobacteria bacterium]
MRILVVEDDPEVNLYISKGLREHGHTVDIAHDGRDGLFLASTERYDVIVLDRMLPQLEGLKVVRNLRANENATPVLILSALGEVDDRVEGLKSGGDDYLIKPFAFVELLARLESLGRRGQPTNHSDIVLKAGDLVMDVLARKVARGGEPVSLQAREFKLLEFLLRHKNQVVTRTMLLEHVWEYHFDPQTNVIDVHISRLRQKIDTDPGRSLIKTIRGAGYTIEDPGLSVS